MKDIYRYIFTDKDNSFLTVYSDCYGNAMIKAAKLRGVDIADITFYSVEEMFSISDS